MDTFHLSGLLGVKAFLLRGALGVADHGPLGGCDLKVIGVGAVPIAAPLPDVAGHVAQAVGARWIRADGGGGGKAVGVAIVVGEIALVDVGHPLAAGLEFVAPGVAPAGLAAARGELPL